MIFPCRAPSSARLTSSRIAISRSHRATSAGSVSASTAARTGNSATCTEASRVPGRWRHSSSAVTGRIGASSRARPSAMMYIAVCAERRSGEPAANVYRRSFDTSA